MRRTFLAVVMMVLGAAGGLGEEAPAPKAPGLMLAPQSGSRYQCGPTTLASVLAFHGVAAPEAEIAAKIYSPTARGVLLTDMAWFARSREFRTDVRTGSMAELRDALAAGRPPIVLLDLGRGPLRQPHFTAIIAWDEEGVCYLSAGPAGRRVSHETFARQWQRAGNQWLLLSPAS